MRRLHGSLNPRIAGFPASAASRLLPFPEVTGEIHTQFRGESPPQLFFVLRGGGKRENEELGETRSDAARRSSDRPTFPRANFSAGEGHLRGLLAADSSPRSPKAHFAWIRVGKLEATAIYHRRCRGSPMCKKELSSNRINDPLASIYRTRERWRGRETRRRDAQRRTRRTVFEGRRSGSCFSTSSFRRATPLVRGKYYLLSCGAAESLCRRRKFNRSRTLSPDASVNPVFGAYILSLGCETSGPAAAVVAQRKYPMIYFSARERDAKIGAFRRFGGKKNSTLLM